MFRQLILIITFLLSLQAIALGADKAPVFTQKDFARMILQQFSWNDGLSKDPVDRDYLMILSGKRTFRYEAENAYNELTDLVSMRVFPTFGAFTGTGWLMGVSKATHSTFTIWLPVAGEYDLKGVIKGNGFIWNIDGKEYTADSKSASFKETEVAKVTLKAGIVTVLLTIPPDGAIDSFSLTAPDYPSIQPFTGWRFKEGLKAARLAEIAVALTNSYAQLPDAAQEVAPKPVFVSEISTLPTTVALTTAPYLGHFSSPKWVRAGFGEATLQIPLVAFEPGYYNITANAMVNAMGETISGSVNNMQFKLAAKPYLDKVNLGVYRLENGSNTLTLTFPPAGGIDVIEFNKKSTTPDDFLRLSGVSGPADRLIGAEEATKLLKKIQDSYPVRK